MTARGQHEHGVERLRNELLPLRELLGDAVLATHRRKDGLRQVADRGDLEPIGQLAQVVEVHDLGDQATADHPYFQSPTHISPALKPRLERSTESIRTPRGCQPPPHLVGRSPPTAPLPTLVGRSPPTAPLPTPVGRAPPTAPLPTL